MVLMKKEAPAVAAGGRRRSQGRQKRSAARCGGGQGVRSVIYVSGPITDNATGLSRKGWQEEFLEAGAKLEAMGFSVVTPVEVAEEAQSEWETENPGGAEAPRWYFIQKCIEELSGWIQLNRSEYGREWRFAGIYVIGRPHDILSSFGTMCEINFVLSAGLQVWCRHFSDGPVGSMLVPRGAGSSLEEAAGRSVTEKEECI